MGKRGADIKRYLILVDRSLPTSFNLPADICDGKLFYERIGEETFILRRCVVVIFMASYGERREVWA